MTKKRRPESRSEAQSISKDQIPATIIYNAWVSSLKENCRCEACNMLRKLTPYMSIPVKIDELPPMRLEE